MSRAFMIYLACDCELCQPDAVTGARHIVSFKGRTASDAIKKARDAGWSINVHTEKDYAPGHSPKPSGR